jgi:hypothetical protein
LPVGLQGGQAIADLVEANSQQGPQLSAGLIRLENLVERGFLGIDQRLQHLAAMLVNKCLKLIW